MLTSVVKKQPAVQAKMHFQERFLLPRWERCDSAGLTAGRSSGRVAEKTTTRAELWGELMHSLSVTKHRTASQANEMMGSSALA